jgi:hypothetical protein
MPDPHGKQPDPKEQRVPLDKPSTTRQSMQEEAAKFLQKQIASQQAEILGLVEDKKALVAEYITASDDEAPAMVKKNIRARMPKALSVIDDLLDNANDGTKASLAKYIIDRGLNPDSLGGEKALDRELNKLLGELKPDE